jgi:ADP-ribosylglycohydrolase
MNKKPEVTKTMCDEIIFGFAVGDALGVPFEFLEADEIDFKFSDEMAEFGTYHQPAGTFSDDTSMMCCMIEAMIQDGKTKTMADNFLKWKNENFWTANGEVFDIGNTIKVALNAYEKTGDISGAATNNEYSCGNGSLMRILPLLPYIMDKSLDEKFKYIKSVSCITHGHIRTAIACFIYLELAQHIFEQGKIHKPRFAAFLSRTILTFLENNPETKDEVKNFEILFTNLPARIPREQLSNSGYVVDSLILAIHCFFRYNRYEMGVWYAISFGGDTDTNAALTGALYTLYGGKKEIPARWLNKLVKKEELENLSQRWASSLNKAHEILN